MTAPPFPRISAAMTKLAQIRNFSIVAHIDHGKSTLADRLIQMTGTVAARDMKAQLLDSMDIERERGITIKANTVRIEYPARDGLTYILNLIDTPGHVDFGYEVSRSMRAVEGSLLVVDATQGVEAQTLANVYQAIDAGHEIVPVLNKIDLPAAEPELVKAEIEDVIGIDASHAIAISAKTGLGIPEVLEAIVTRLPAPKGDQNAPLKAMLVDSWYDSYLGVVVMIRVMDGIVRRGDRIKMMQTGAVYGIDTLAVLKPQMVDIDELGPGEIGVFTASIKQLRDTRVGDTVTHERKPCEVALPGFKPSQPVVFCGLFPVDAADFEALRDAIEKLLLNAEPPQPNDPPDIESSGGEGSKKKQKVRKSSGTKSSTPKGSDDDQKFEETLANAIKVDADFGKLNKRFIIGKAALIDRCKLILHFSEKPLSSSNILRVLTRLSVRSDLPAISKALSANKTQFITNGTSPVLYDFTAGTREEFRKKLSEADEST